MYQQQSPQPHGEHEWNKSSGSYEEGYGGNFQQSDQLADAIARRLQSQSPTVLAPLQRPPYGITAGMRLALAIVSVAMLVPLAAIILGVFHEALFGGLIGLGVVGVVILGINLLFNSHR